jgi:predicted membrane channel-forming protein YqfA (hemolysin III family)
MERTGSVSEKQARLHRKLKISAYLLIAGLAIEGITLQWAHPTSFLLFIILGGILISAGVAVYLIEILTA